MKCVCKDEDGIRIDNPSKLHQPSQLNFIGWNNRLGKFTNATRKHVLPPFHNILVTECDILCGKMSTSVARIMEWRKYIFHM